MRLLQRLVAIDDPLILREQKLQVIDTLLWKYTEADGKYNTPFRSLAACNFTAEGELRHEHVWTRSELKQKLLASAAEQVEAILQEAVGCIVTFEEHQRLSRFDRAESGWRRYECAGVPWVDLRNPGQYGI